MKYIYISIITLYSISTFAQETFSRRYHFDRQAAILSCIAVTDSAYYGVGITNDTLPPFRAGNFFAKFNFLGDVEFVKIYVDTARTLEVWKSPLLKTTDNGFAAAGYSFNEEMSGIFIKYNNVGDTVFISEYNSVFHTENDFIVPRGLLQTNDNGFIIMNHIENTAANNEICLTKMSPSGELEWQQPYFDGYDEKPESLITDEAGNFYIGAIKINNNIVNSSFVSRTRILKTNPDGELLWEYDTPFNWGLMRSADGMIQSADGGFVIASGKGIEEPVGAGGILHWDHYIFKLNADMELEWGTDFRSNYTSYINCFHDMIALSDESGYVAVGTIVDTTFSPNPYGINGHLAKVSSDGDSVWHRLYHVVESSLNYQVFSDIKETPDGGFLLCGESFNRDHIDSLQEGEIRQQAWLVKLDQYGCLVPGCHLLDQVDVISKSPHILLYPNPVSDYLNIYIGRQNITKELHFQLFNVQGQLVKSFKSPVPDITHMLPVYDIEQGIYFLRVTDGERLLFSEELVIMR